MTKDNQQAGPTQETSGEEPEREGTNDSSAAEKTSANRLLTRAANINNSLIQSLNSIVDVKRAIDTDRNACEQLSSELANWEQALSDLEKAVAATPTGGNGNEQSGEDESSRSQLLKTIEVQKEQIGSLESRLNTLLRQTAVNTTDARTDDGEEIADLFGRNTYSNRVIITMDREGNLKFPLDKNIITIGRQPGNDIYIRSRYLSRFHARIVSDALGSTIEDLDSANGVIVNSRRIRRRQLRSGDLITLGKTQLQYIDISEGTDENGRA